MSDGVLAPSANIAARARPCDPREPGSDSRPAESLEEEEEQVMNKSTRKVAIVTGSATGVGAATAILLAGKGCNVVINYTRSKTEAEETAALCRAKGAETIVFQADVADDDACRGMAAAAAEKWGRIDYLVNNAARTKFNPYPKLDGVSKQDFLDIYAVNVVGAYQMVRAVAPYMKKQGAGAIVNDSSIGGVTGIASSIPYAASKAALNLMTKSLAHVLAPEIRINTVVPGMIQTRWLKGGMGDEQYEAMIRTQGQLLPLKKVATPEDIAAVLVWFLESAALITGETLIVDSGIHLGQLPPYSSGDAY
jgi:3-oxoacyl-[acyl-carrier protein] reductase